MLARLGIAVVIGVIVTLACVLLGAILVALKVEIAVTVGNFLKQWSGVIGILAFMWTIFSGPTPINK